jgi:hypothetical protein
MPVQAPPRRREALCAEVVREHARAGEQAAHQPVRGVAAPAAEIERQARATRRRLPQRSRDHACMRPRLQCVEDAELLRGQVLVCVTHGGGVVAAQLDRARAQAALEPPSPQQRARDEPQALR